MQNIDLSWLLDPKFVLGSLWAAALVIAGAIITVVRGRIRVMQYTVHHNPIGVTLKDEKFGDVQISYHGTALSKLWLTRIDLVNDSGKDFERLEVRVYTGDGTLLLGERTELSVLGFDITQTDAYAQKLATAADTKPTAAQWQLYGHERDYAVPVFNRGDSATWFILTTLTPPSQGSVQAAGPNVWLSMQHAGARLRYRHVGQEVRGVPVKTAATLAILVTLAAYVVSCYFIANPWIAAAPAVLVALFGQVIGVAFYKALRFAISLVAR